MLAASQHSILYRKLKTLKTLRHLELCSYLACMSLKTFEVWNTINTIGVTATIFCYDFRPFTYVFAGSPFFLKLWRICYTYFIIIISHVTIKIIIMIIIINCYLENCVKFADLHSNSKNWNQPFLSMVEIRPSSSLSAGNVVPLRTDWAIYCHAGSRLVGTLVSRGKITRNTCHGRRELPPAI